MIDQSLKQNIENVIFSSDNSEVVESLNNLFELYLNTLSTIDVNLKWQKSIKTPNGLAIAPFDALNCFKDYWRTAKYLKGTYKAIKNLLKKFPNENLTLVDAGCGPIAPLVLPLLVLFPEKNIKVTLIDFHEASLETALKVYENLGMKEFIEETICENAATVNLPKDKKYHLVSAEAIMANLIREAQVAITFNLGSQLQEDGIIIPEMINIQAKLINASEEIPYIQQNYPNIKAKGNIDRDKLGEYRYNLNSIFCLNLDLVRDFSKQNPNIKFPSIINTGQVILPEKLPSSNFNFMLEMNIKVYENIEITSYESGLTHPMMFTVQEPFGSLKGLQFIYNITHEPGFSYQPIFKDQYAQQN